MKKGFILLLMLGSFTMANAQYWAPYGFYFFNKDSQKKSQQDSELEESVIADEEGSDNYFRDLESKYYADPDAHYKNRN